ACAVVAPAGRVRPPAQRHVPVADRDVGVVVLRLRELADPIHECERLDEAGKLEGALERSVHLAPALGRHTWSIYDRCRMTFSTEDASGGEVTRAEPRRAGRELVLELAFRPLSKLLV